MVVNLKPVVLVILLLSLSDQLVTAQNWEKATKPQVELAKDLHQWLKSGNQKAIFNSYMQPVELIEFVKDQQRNINPDLVTQLLNVIGKVPLNKGDKTLTDLIGGGDKMIDWTRVYLKYVWQASIVNTTGFDIDMLMIQFGHGAAKVWLQAGVVKYDGKLHLCLLKEWKITRDGVVNLPIPESTEDLSKFAALRRSIELRIDLARFPNPISKAVDKVPISARASVAAFERATSVEDLGTHVFNCCVAGDFNAVGMALVPASINTGTEGLSAGQFEVLAALDLEKLYANAMVYWRFHWQDCVLKTVFYKDGEIVVTFNTLFQFMDGKTRKAELAFSIYGSRQIEGIWYLSTNPEHPTGIASVTMQGVMIDVSGLIEVSGRLTVDGKPLDNAVVTMTPWVTPPRNSKAERGLNSRIPSGRTNAKGEFTMTVTYNSDMGKPVVFSKIATNKYIVGVFDGTPIDSKDSTLEPSLTDLKSSGGIKNSAVQRVPQEFANPFALKGEGKFLTVDKALTTVLIQLTSDGKMEVVASSP